MNKASLGLSLLGVLLLLPGLCGGLFYGGALFELMNRGALKFRDYDEIVWIVAVPAICLGSLGLFTMAKAWKTERAIKAARIGSIVALALTIGAILIFLLQPGDRYPLFSEEMLVIIAMLGGSWLVGGLPGLLNKDTPRSDA